MLSSIADSIRDYRSDELEKPSPDHVEEWVSQFEEGAQDEILKEMDHVLAKTYVDESAVKGFLNGLSKLEKLTGDSPKEFWKKTQLLNIQRAGSSQHELLRIFDKVLQGQFTCYC